MDRGGLAVLLRSFRGIAVELPDPVVDQLLVLLQVQLLVVGDGGNDGLLAHRLVLGVAELRQVRVAEGLLRADSLLGVELQHPHEQVQSVSGSLIFKPLLQGLNLAGAQGVDHGRSHLAVERLDIASRGLSYEGDNPL